MCLQDISIDFLNKGETFLGVILTLNVLCLFFKDESNFIFGVLNKLWAKLKNELENLQKSVSADEEKFQNDKRYKALRKFTTSLEDIEHPDTLQQRALQIKYDLDNKLLGLKTDLSPAIMTMERIKLSNEQTRAPFFTFIFGLAIFSVQEVCNCVEPATAKLILPGVWIFTFLSIIYWLAIWSAFIFRKMKDDENDREPESKRFWKRVDEKYKWKTGGIVKIICCAAIAAFTFALFTINGYCGLVIYVGILLLPICIIGIWRLISCGVKGKYSYMHILGHAAAFFVYSIVLASIYDIWGNGACDDLFLNCNTLNGCIIFFALFNGIIFPFILPYYKYHSQYKTATSNLKQERMNLNNIISSFGTDFQKWSTDKFLYENTDDEPRKNS